MSNLNETWNFSADFRKNTQISNWIKIRSVGAELFHADGRADGQMDKHDEAKCRFLQFYAGH